MKEIQLANNKGVAVVDDEDFVFLIGFKWSLSKNHGRSPYANAKVLGSSRRMHQVIMERILGRKLLPGEQVDHKNGIGLENFRSNLRLADNQKNSFNRKRLSKHGYKGIGFDKRCRSKPWKAQIKYKGDKKHLGHYETAQDAARTYDWFARLYFGEFARLNFPNE